MQFAGQRTDLELQPIGEPVNLLVQLDEDTLPSPGAIMVTKITPQQTRLDGLSEREFCQYVMDEIFTPGTIATGYNSVHFDDEFMRFCFWRNFFNPYEWQWKDERSRWDLLDVARMTRALRPDGIEWPVDSEGKATNRLELITKLNGIEHKHAHDALSDVEALIDVTRLIREHQPDLLRYLFRMRDKRCVAELVSLDHPQPFVYSAGQISSEFEKTTVMYPLASGKNGSILVADLRQDPTELTEETIFPAISELALNRCPAVAPLGVLEKNQSWERIKLDKEQITQNLQKYLKRPELIEWATKEKKFEDPVDVESALYDGFVSDYDNTFVSAVRNASDDKLKNFHPKFKDRRLSELLVHYKAKNCPEALTEAEMARWEKYRADRLNRQAPKFMHEMKVLQKTGKTERGTPADEYAMEELALWYQSLQ